MFFASRATFTSVAVIASATIVYAKVGGRFLDAGRRGDARTVVLARAQVWRPTNVASMDLKNGPTGAGAFPFGATVVCTYHEKHMEGNSPKFACVIGGHDEVKVKYGGANGEVLGEVLATRLLWALGFGADRMYPVKVICRGCPQSFGGTQLSQGMMRFDPAVIERKMPGSEWPREGKSGWSWSEIDTTDSGTSRTQRDALKLLAVFLQHTDSKPEQQRILCLSSRQAASARSCAHPFLMINDVGMTFGTNADETSSVNLIAWRRTAVWKGATGCTGNLPESLTGTLKDAAISENGRRFLADLLGQLSDHQIHDLFEAARVHLRLRDPRDLSSGFATTEEWVAAFKEKRAQIAGRHCTQS